MGWICWHIHRYELTSFVILMWESILTLEEMRNGLGKHLITVTTEKYNGLLKVINTAHLNLKHTSRTYWLYAIGRAFSSSVWHTNSLWCSLNYRSCFFTGASSLCRKDGSGTPCTCLPYSASHVKLRFSSPGCFPARQSAWCGTRPSKGTASTCN